MSDNRSFLNAFKNPTVGTRERLGIRTSSSSNSPTSDSVTSVTSRRSESMIQTAEDAEIFEKLSQSTTVSLTMTKKTKSSNDSVVSGAMDTLIRSFSRASSSKDEARQSGSSDNEDIHRKYDDRLEQIVTDDIDECEKVDQNVKESEPVEVVNAQNEVKCESVPKTNHLDLNNNDNSFHVLATLLVEFFVSKIEATDKTMTLVPEDRVTIQRLLPESARMAFINAVRHRSELTPIIASSPLESLVLKCQKLHMDEMDSEVNPILVATNLDDAPVTLSMVRSIAPMSIFSKPLTICDDSDEEDYEKGEQDDDSEEDINLEENVFEEADVKDLTQNKAGVDVGSLVEETVFSKSVDQDLIENESLAKSLDEQTSDAEKLIEILEIETGYEDEDDTHETDNLVTDQTSAQGSDPEKQPSTKEPAMSMMTITINSADDEWDSCNREEKQTCKSTNEIKSSSESSFRDARLAVQSTFQVIPTETSSTQQPCATMETFGSMLDGYKPPFSFSTGTSESQYQEQKNTENAASLAPTESTTNQPLASMSQTAYHTKAIDNFALINDTKMYIDFSKYEEMHVHDVQVKERLLSELREASTMLAKSETPETAHFWREHTNGLMARLSALRINAFERSDSIEDISHASPQRETLIKPKTSKMMDLLDDLEAQSQSVLTREVRPQEEAILPQFRSLSNMQDIELLDVPMVDVVAPADLPAGYNFEAEIEGQRFLATVPPGGVQQGETFTCYMRELSSVSVDIPVGHWKDGLLNVFKYGCCHPVLWHGLFCPLFALGQIQQRISLDFLGRPRFGTEDISNRSMMTIIVVFWVATNTLLFAACNLKWFHGIELSIGDVSAIVLTNVAMFSFVAFVTQSTRSSLRDKFMIREERCFDLEDLCCATICLPCTVCQMARHTANYDDYEAVCCSKTGLPDGVVVNEFSRKESNVCDA